MICHRRVALARCCVQVDSAGGAQASTVPGADLFGIEFDQCELADHGREVELSVLDGVRVFVGQFDLIQLVNADDGKVEKWKMTWKGSVLELFDGKTTLKLTYTGTNNC